MRWTRLGQALALLLAGALALATITYTKAQHPVGYFMALSWPGGTMLQGEMPTPPIAEAQAPT